MSVDRPEQAWVKPPATVADMIARSVAREHRVGGGAQGVVYRLAAPGHPDFMLKRCRAISDRLPWQGERRFIEQLRSDTSLVPVPHPLSFGNFGQAVLASSRGDFAILRTQPGMPVDQYIDRLLPTADGLNAAPSGEEKYRHYLRWLMDELPERSLIDLAEKVGMVRQSGWQIDHSKKDNLFYDEQRQRFGLIDLNDRHCLGDLRIPGKRFGTLVRPIEKLSSSLQGYGDPQLSIAAEVGKLLTFDAMNRFHAPGMCVWPGRAEMAQTAMLEGQVKHRIAQVIERHAERIDQAVRPKAVIWAKTVEAIGSAPVSALNASLDGFLEQSQAAGHRPPKQSFCAAARVMPPMSGASVIG